MGRENRKEAIANLHRAQILAAAEAMFTKKGFTQTTIEDISRASAYSRRTIYAYFESKEDILHHIISRGLMRLKGDMEKDLRENDDFLPAYFAICRSVAAYQRECPHSLENVMEAGVEKMDAACPSPALAQIFDLGTKINALWAECIERGKAQKLVRQEVKTMQTVYVLTSGVTALNKLVQTKGPYLSGALSMSEEEFLEYGLTQMVNSILEVRI